MTYITKLLKCSKSYISLILVLFVVACSSDPSPTKEEVNGTGEMARLLDSLRLATNPMDNYSLNSGRAAYWKQQISKMTDDNQLINAKYQYASELLRAGKVEQSITELTALVEIFETNNIPISESTKPIYDNLALAWMRLGEQANCLANPTMETCIIPIKEDGIHVYKQGSETAIEVFKKILNVFPDDDQSKWMLNLAYMTIGEYPDNVPSEYLINPTAFEQKGDAYWENVAASKGVDVNGLSGSVCWEDFNNDGLLDLFVTSYGLDDPCQLFVNTGNGYMASEANASLSGLTGGLNVTHADYNNDGYEDILILRGAWFNKGGKLPNSLLKNNGDGTFTDVTKEAGLLSFHPTQTATWADFNLDGWLDLFIGNETTKVGEETLFHPCEFYLNNGDGTFEELAQDVGLAVTAWVKAVASGDFNNDGLFDIYISIPGEANRLFQNTSHDEVVSFGEVSTQAGVQYPVLSFPAWFWDFDQDGNEDLYVGAYDFRQTGEVGGHMFTDITGQEIEHEQAAVYHNTGEDRFEKVTQSVGLDKSVFSMGSNYGDLNADSYPDFYIGTGSPNFGSVVPNRMFLNQGGRSFDEVTYDGFGHIQKGHGIAFADYDNDGDQDVYAIMGGAFEGDVSRNALFENPAENNQWINIKLEGTSANRSAIGARIVMVVLMDNGQERKIYRTVRTGGSFGSNPLRQYFGLNGVSEIQSITISWPGDSNAEVLSGFLEFNQFYRIKQGEGIQE